MMQGDKVMLVMEGVVVVVVMVMVMLVVVSVFLCVSVDEMYGTIIIVFDLTLKHIEKAKI